MNKIIEKIFTVLGVLLFIAAQSCASSDLGDPAEAVLNSNAGGHSKGKGKPVQLSAAQFLIEHNSADEDTGFQLFVDGEAWSELTLKSPGGETLLFVQPGGKLRDLGLTSLFFESSEPPNKEVPISQHLANFPEGKYQISGLTVAKGSPIEGEATLTHAIPAGAEITLPQGGSVLNPTDPVMVEWEPVELTLFGGPVQILAYQVIVTKETDPLSPHGFTKQIFSVHVPSNVTRVTVSPEFLEHGCPYEVEVLAIEESGNQTISIVFFETE